MPPSPPHFPSSSGFSYMEPVHTHPFASSSHASTLKASPGKHCPFSLALPHSPPHFTCYLIWLVDRAFCKKRKIKTISSHGSFLIVQRARMHAASSHLNSALGFFLRWWILALSESLWGPGQHKPAYTSKQRLGVERRYVHPKP